MHAATEQEETRVQEAQREAAEKSKRAAGESGNFSDPIVTEITEAELYYKAEGYHQDYYSNNSEQGFCSFVLRPKLEKLGLKH